MSYDNLAYETERREAVEEKRQARKKKHKAAKRQRKSAVGYFKIIVCIMLITASAFLMISRKVELYESEVKISELEKQLATAESVTCQKTFDLENTVDLKTIEEIATTKLGMQRPEKYQVVYVNVNKADNTEVTANEVEGVGNKIVGSYETIKKNVVGIFSID